MADTARLDMPEISASQSGKETTHNEALKILDCLVQCTPEDKDATAPPGSPSAGDTYIVAASATGAWSGEDGNIAYYDGSSWIFITPIEGFVVYLKDENLQYYYNGSAWASL